jgi:hypothetical protein
MKKLIKKDNPDKEAADKAIIIETDEMEKIRIFIRKKQLENRILKKLAEDIQTTLSDELNKSKSA